MAVQAQREIIPPAPEAVAMLRTCEPTPALVKLLADTATAWGNAGRLDDAVAALSLALCAHSAMRAREVPTLPTLEGRHHAAQQE